MMFVCLNRLLKLSVLPLFFVLLSPIAMATTENTQSVIGYWQTTDSKTQKPSSIIQILDRKGVVEGKIVKTYPAKTEKKIEICTLCTGSQKNKPIIGLTIINNMVCISEKCTHGTILDPRDGKLYHATMQLKDSGQLLKVRGYVGMPLFGKTVIWKRVDGVK